MGKEKREEHRYWLTSWCVSHLSFILFSFSFLVYLLTLDRSVSWWDCGEFIATGWTLGIGHPPGAPTYQLLTHLFMLLSFGNPMWVAPLSNAVSALCGGVTVAVLYLTLREFGCRPFGAVLGALCYLFSDTAWFSAVESEVYAPAMLFCSLDVWLALRFRRRGNLRLLLLLALLLGLGVGVHLMTLLVLPALTVIVLPRLTRYLGHPSKASLASTAALALLFFFLGLSTYAVVPLRAQADPPINELGESFGSYLRREQYEKAPLYPRMWRERDSVHWADWNAGRTDLVGNVAYYASYQLGYMYLRYLMYNFIGRENFHWHCIVPFVLPFLLGLCGLWRHRRRSRGDFWAVMLLFLFGGVILNLYLNHPCYEPRERDYAYVLSFYAFAIWIGIGTDDIRGKMKDEKAKRRGHQNSFLFPFFTFLLLLAPLTLAVGNWSDHDRSRSHSVHDIAAAHLDVCEPDAILITLGDNDTFPLWYLQQVEGRRPDVGVYNLGLTGWQRVLQLIATAGDRPVYVSHYFYQRYAYLFPDRLRCEGFCWRLLPMPAAELRPPDTTLFEWHITPREYIDPVSRRFLDTWQHNTGHTVVPSVR